MRISYAYPPNYAEIVKALPAVKTKAGIIFTYGDTIYNPSRGKIPVEIEKHEAVHWQQQQAMGIDKWWAEYLANPEFRFNMELEVYRVHYRAAFSYGRAARRYILKGISKDLSSAWYGHLCTTEEAKEQIIANEG